MLFRLILLFTAIPLIELYLLIRLGSAIGALYTILLVIVTAVTGAWLSRREGLTPGLITDTVGILLLLPPVRVRVREWLKKKFSDWMRNGKIQVRRY